MSPSESFNMAIMALNTFEVGSAPPYFDMNLQVILIKFSPLGDRDINFFCLHFHRARTGGSSNSGEASSL